MSRKSRAGNPLVAVAYLRVSTEEQHLGPEAQRAAIAAWAAREGVHVVSWHVDQGISGASEPEKRPALLEALAALHTQGAGVLAIHKRDRLARDAFIALSIERAVVHAGARIRPADGTADGDEPASKFMRTMLDGSNEFELAQIRARTRAALAVKKARGERVGTVPYGFEVALDGKMLVPNESEQKTIVIVRRLRAAGRSYRRILAALAKRGIRSRRGNLLTLSAVHHLVHNAKQVDVERAS
jgi:DNA invertase Pin-like site-specific DNA recombinase